MKNKDKKSTIIGASVVILIYIMMIALAALNEISSDTAQKLAYIVAILLIGFIIFCIKGLVGSIKAMNDIKIKKEEEERQKKIKEIKFKQQRFAERNEEISKKVGLSKLQSMESYEMLDKFDAQMKAAEAMRKLGVIMATSVYQEKEKDWALHAGMATAIGGMGAGLENAMNTAAENQRIKAENAARREWGKQYAIECYKNAIELDKKREDARTLEQIENEYNTSFNKDKETLKRDIKLFVKDIDKDFETGTITISVHWSVGEQTTWIDGAFLGTLFDGKGQQIGTAYLPLPKMGTAAGSGDIESICFAESNIEPDYVEFEPINLWEFAPKGVEL